MTLRRMMTWIRRSPDLAAAPVNKPAAGSEDDRVNARKAVEGASVIAMPRALAPIAGQAIEGFAERQPKPARITGLMNAPELEAFFELNQFGFGRHHGGHYRSRDALDRGLEAVIAEFQHIVAGLAERRQAKIDRLELARHDVSALSQDIAGQLGMAIEQTRRELNALNEQVMFAEQHRGWVLDALNRYRLGFDRGVREAIDYELLGT